MGPPASYRVSRVRYYSGATWLVSDFVYGSFTLFAWLFQNHSTIFLNTFRWSATPKNKSFGLASFPFARRYLGNRCFFLLLGLLRCFSSPRFLILRYFIHTAVPAHYYRWVPPFGNLRFITDICSLPQLIAACHVLHRLLVPRHPPYALFNLTSCLSFSPSASLPSLASVLTYLCTLRSSLLQRLAVREKSFAVLINFLLC